MRALLQGRPSPKNAKKKRLSVFSDPPDLTPTPQDSAKSGLSGAQNADISAPRGSWCPKWGSIGPHALYNQIRVLSLSPETAPGLHFVLWFFCPFSPLKAFQPAAKLGYFSRYFDPPLKPVDCQWTLQEANLRRQLLMLGCTPKTP